MKIKILLLVLTSFLVSCESSLNRFTQDDRSNNTFSSAEVGSFASVVEGTIVSINQVNISGSKGMGSALGALAVGTAAVDRYDSRSGRTNAAILGGLIGATAGKYIEENLTKDVGYQFLIRLNSGEVKSVVQTDVGGLRVGDRVFITYDNNTARVTRI